MLNVGTSDTAGQRERNPNHAQQNHQPGRGEEGRATEGALKGRGSEGVKKGVEYRVEQEEGSKNTPGVQYQ